MDQTQTPQKGPAETPDRVKELVRDTEAHADKKDLLDHLRNQLSVMRFSREELSEFAAEIQKSAILQNLDAAKTAVLDVVRNQMTDLKNSILQNITPETKTVVKIAGGAAVGALLLAGFLKAKSAVNTGVKKVKTGFKWLLGLTAVAGATYLGFKAWQNWGEMMKLGAHIENLTNKASKAVGETKAMLEQQLKDAQAKLAELQKEVPSKVIEASAVPDSAPATPKPVPTQKEDAVEIAKDSVESGAVEVMGAGLLLLNGALAKEAGIKEEAERNAVAVVLNKPAIQSLKIGNLKTISSQADAASRLDANASDAEKKALHFLALACNKLAPRVEEALAREPEAPNIDDLTLQDFLDRLHHLPRMFVRLQAGLKGKSLKDIPDVANVIAGAFTDDSFDDIASDPGLREELVGLGLEGKEGQFFAYCVARGRTLLLKDIAEDENTNETERMIQSALIEIRAELANAEMKAYLEQYLHGRDDLPFKDTLEKHLNENLTVFDAVQLYMYLQLARTKDNELPKNIKDSSPVGALLTQMKVLDLLGKTGNQNAIHLRDYLLLQATKGPGAINLPEGTTEFLAEMTSKAAEVGWEATFKYAKKLAYESYAALYEFTRDQPEWAAGIAASALSAGGYVGYRWKAQDWTLRVADRLQADKLPRRLSWLAPTDQLRKTGSLSIPRQIADKLISVQDSINTLKNQKQAAKLIHQFSELNRRGYHPASFKKFYDQLATLRKAGADPAVLDDVLSKVQNIEINDAKILQKYRFGIVRRAAGATGRLGYRTAVGTAKIGIKAGAEALNITTDAARAIAASPYWGEALEFAGSKADDILAILSKIDMPAEIANAFAKSKGAMQMLLNASKQGGSAAVNYLTKLAGVTRIASKVGGGAVLGLDVLLCAFEMAMNQMRIAATDNKDLKDLYAARDNVSLANAAAGTGFGVSLYAVGWAPAGAVVSASTFAPAIPALIVAGYAHGKIEAVTETWLKNEDDWAKESAGTLRAKMKELGVGKQSYWQNAANGTRFENYTRWLAMSGEEFDKWEEQGYKTVEDANELTRYKLTKAYLARMTDLPQRKGESQEQYDERFKTFQRDQLTYVRDTTDGAYGTVNTYLYRNAETHATLMTLSRDLKAKNASQILTLQIDSDADGKPEEKEFDLATYADFKNTRETRDGLNVNMIIAAYEKQERQLALVQSRIIREIGSTDPEALRSQEFVLQNAILKEIRHDLPLFEENLLKADVKGLEITGGEDATRDRIRFAMSTELRTLLRTEAVNLRMKENVSVADIEAAIDRIKSFLQQPMTVFEKLSQKPPYVQGVKTLKDPSQILTDFHWIQANFLLPQGTQPSSKAA